jgi:hypothetical protein
MHRCVDYQDHNSETWQKATFDLEIILAATDGLCTGLVALGKGE